MDRPRRLQSVEVSEKRRVRGLERPAMHLASLLSWWSGSFLRKDGSFLIKQKWIRASSGPICFQGGLGLHGGMHTQACSAGVGVVTNINLMGK
mmetsp:Transcript_55289/g.108179  ORF Transcript_55289/g.108179 Transcript_55289/m.108179 type:complete len:93 (-) Transcript_55289:44-322(-)